MLEGEEGADIAQENGCNTMYRSKDEGHVEMYGRVPSSTSGDNASDEDNDNEKTPLSGVHDSPWLHRGPSTPTKARRGVTKLVGALRGVSLKRVFQVLGMRRSEVCHLPREIPLDGTFSAAAALARGRKGRGAVNEGLAAAHAVPNIVRNQKYRAVTFVFEVLYEQFRYFFNLYFLLVALSQLIPELQVGFLFTYIAPLVFVLSITLAKEGFDDYKRFVRDKESNSQRYQRLTTGGSLQSIPSSDIRVGDIILIPAGARVPADMVLLRTTDKSGTVFIRTGFVVFSVVFTTNFRFSCTRTTNMAVLFPRPTGWRDRLETPQYNRSHAGAAIGRGPVPHACDSVRR